MSVASPSTATLKNKKSDRITDKLNDLYKEGVSLNDFHVLNLKIGEGGFAKVMKVRHVKTREIYACKVIKLSPIRELRKQCSFDCFTFQYVAVKQKFSFEKLTSIIFFLKVTKTLIPQIEL